MFRTCRTAAGLWVLGVACLAPVAAQSPTTQPAEQTLPGAPPATQPAEGEQPVEAVSPAAAAVGGALFYQAPPRPSRTLEDRMARDLRTGRRLRAPVDDARLTQPPPRRSVGSAQAFLPSASKAGEVTSWPVPNAWNPQAYPQWWKRPSKASDIQLRTPYWARDTESPRGPRPYQRPTTLDLRATFTTEQVSRYQMNAYSRFTGRNAVGFRTGSNTVDYLNPTTGQWYYGVPNGVGGQDWYDPRTGRWVFGAPANRGPGMP